MKRAYWRLFVAGGLFAIAISLIWWRGPDWHLVRDAFSAVSWPWVVGAVALNLASVVVRALAWNTVIRQATSPPRPGFRLVFSAFCVGLFANAVLPGRVGELGRVAVLVRRMPRRAGIWAKLIGTVVAHRMFDLFPTIALVIWVLLYAKVPHWALMTLAVVLVLGLSAFALAVYGARGHSLALEGLGRIRALLLQARTGLAIMRAPLPAALAVTFQSLGWLCQLLAVWAAMNAFDIRQPLVAAGLVLLLVNVISVFPFWPGNVGLVQAGIAVSLSRYGVDYARGFAYGIGLQAIEASVGIGIGTLFLAREGISYGMLKQIESAQEAAAEAEALGGEAGPRRESREGREGAGARVPG